MDVLLNFLRKSEPVGECRIWKGKAANGEYVQTTYNGVRILAHRLSYLLFKGEIPEGMLVLHKCDTPKCVNPLHLFLGSNMDNMRDMTAKGRHSGQKKTHCPKGHEYTPENLVPKLKHRSCLICQRARSKAQSDAKSKKQKP